jgi:3-oxoacyl-[acyl-carrier-protein] synthase-3
MMTTFHGKKITGIISILPKNEYDYDDEVSAFATVQTRRLKKIMGFNKRRAAKENSTTSDFCIYGLRYILDKEYIKRDDIGALIVVGLTPDYFLPQISNIIQGECDLKHDVICMDIAQGCAGHILGLMQACMLLDAIGDKKVLVFTGDVLNRKDINTPISAPSFGGDATTITIVENDQAASNIYMNMYMNGAERNALIIHAGGYRMPRTEETAKLIDVGDGTLKSYNDLWMDGSKVFNFIQREVPPLIHEILQYSKRTREEIDWYFFHQPNRFILEKLADKLGLPREKVPMDIVENFGNSSGSTIPVNITYNLAEKALNNIYLCCLSGFGAGLTWGAMIMELGKLDFCEMIVSDY